MDRLIGRFRRAILGDRAVEHGDPDSPAFGMREIVNRQPVPGVSRYIGETEKNLDAPVENTVLAPAAKVRLPDITAERDPASFTATDDLWVRRQAESVRPEDGQGFTATDDLWANSQPEAGYKAMPRDLKDGTSNTIAFEEKTAGEHHDPYQHPDHQQAVQQDYGNNGNQAADAYGPGDEQGNGFGHEPDDAKPDEYDHSEGYDKPGDYAQEADDYKPEGYDKPGEYQQATGDYKPDGYDKPGDYAREAEDYKPDGYDKPAGYAQEADDYQPEGYDKPDDYQQQEDLDFKPAHDEPAGNGYADHSEPALTFDCADEEEPEEPHYQQPVAAYPAYEAEVVAGEPSGYPDEPDHAATYVAEAGNTGCDDDEDEAADLY